MKSEKNLAILCNSTGFGGLELNTLKLAQWLRQYGWKVSLMVGEGTVMHKKAVEMGEEVDTMPPKSKVLGFDKAAHLNRWLKKVDAPIVFTPLNKDIATVALYKYIYNNNLNLVYQQQMKVGIKKKDLIHTLRYNKVDLWVAPLDYLKQEVLDRTRVPEERIAVIPLGIETDRYFKNNITKEAARNELNLPQDVKLMGVLGRIDPKKGQDFLIKAVNHLKDHPTLNYHLMIMGAVTPNEGDHYLNSLYESVKALGLQNRVHFRESRSETEFFYSAIDVFAMPSHGETFGMVTVEAMASGKPIIGHDKDGTKELLQDGRLGYLYQFDDLNDFRRKLQALEDNKQLPQMLDAARQEVLNKYTHEIMCRKLNDAFIKLME